MYRGDETIDSLAQAAQLDPFLAELAQVCAYDWPEN
jgi:hypothetical protein